jgi:hypothetical protein
MIPQTKKVFQIHDALLTLRPASSWSITGDQYVDINWLDTENACPSQEEIEAEIVRLQAEYDAEFYRLQRAKAYPAIGDQLDALFHAGVFPPEMAAQIQAIKDLYPKPSN